MDFAGDKTQIMDLESHRRNLKSRTVMTAFNLLKLLEPPAPLKVS